MYSMPRSYDVVDIAEKITRNARDLDTAYEALMARMATVKFKEYCAQEGIDAEEVKKDIDEKIRVVYDYLDNAFFDIDSIIDESYCFVDAN